MKRNQWLKQLALQDDVAEQKARLETQLAEWTARLNKSRKPSLIAMRSLHVNAIRKELESLKV